MKTRYASAVALVLLHSVAGVGRAQEDDHATWSDPSPHEIRSIGVAPDVRLEVLDWGGEGDPLVFLAGLSMNAHAFDDFAPRFTEGFRVLGITRRGHGASSWPETGYSEATRVRDLLAVLDSLDLEWVTLAGHSLAGGEITLLAAEHPERVKALVYIDAAHDPTLLTGLRIPEVCPMGQNVIEAIERRFENLEALNRTQKREGPEGVLVPWISNAAMEEIITAETVPDYSAVRAPALAVYHVPQFVEEVVGGVSISDACASALQRYIYEGIAGFAEGMEGGRIVAIQDGQHNLHLVVPDELESIMKRWLAGLTD